MLEIGDSEFKIRVVIYYKMAEFGGEDDKWTGNMPGLNLHIGSGR
jgi:hypothetical protein